MLRTLAPLFILPLVIGCRSSTDGGRNDITDPQVLDIGRTLHQGEVDLGRLASERATDARVREYAQRMVTEHSDAIGRGDQLAASLGLTPMPHDISRDLQKEVTEVGNKLREKTGVDFDEAYIDSQVKMHSDALELIRDKLLPNARAEPLKSELRSVDASVVTHLAHARSLDAVDLSKP